MRTDAQEVTRQFLATLGALPEEGRTRLFDEYAEDVAKRKFVPTAGPQLEAYNSPADIMLYGGAAGSGKSSLGVGLALTRHERSLIMRRVGTQLSALTAEAIKMNGTADGFNGSYPQKLRTADGRLIDFGSAQYPGDELSQRGNPHDFLFVDEAGDFLSSQIRNLIGWVRTTTEGQRCRIMLGSNPPTTSDGEWMVQMFAPWLDPQHPNPAKPGELRWFIMDDEQDIEVHGPGKHDHNGQMLTAMSRTFIPGKLENNPFLRDTDYGAKLDMLPEPLRSAVRDGNFMISRRDDLFQVIPTDWIRAAQKRWTPTPPDNVPMCAVGVDIAQGGDDSTTLACRFDGWFAPIVKVPGTATPTGNEIAGLIVSHRRDSAKIILDMGGGYGGAAYMRLCDNDLEEHIISYKGAAGTMKRTADGKLKFSNTRIAAYWKFREALDPAQPNGSPISLPPDTKLVAQLTALRFKESPNGLAPASDSTKEALTARMGESPDLADAVVMAWWGGNTIANIEGGWKTSRSSKNLTVNVGYSDRKRVRH